MQGGQGNLSADIVKNIPFYFANSEEQDKLAKFIYLLDKRIATQNKIIEKYESLIQAIIYKAKIDGISKGGMRRMLMEEPFVLCLSAKGL